MKNARPIFLGFTLLFAGQIFAKLDEQADARTIIQNNYDKISRLSMKKDSARLEKMARLNASSCFESIDAMRNSMDLATTVGQNTHNLARIHKFISSSNRIIGVKQQGEDLVCTVKSSYDVLMDSAGKNRIAGTSISQDTWIKTLTGWKLRKTKVMKESTSRNGKPLK